MAEVLIARSRQVSLVVGAARSRLGSGERVLGPITGGLPRDARCPVVVIPAAGAV